MKNLDTQSALPERLVEGEMVLDGRAAIVRLSRPRALNALNGQLLDELDAVLDSLAEQPEVRVIILTGSEKCFSVGADLKEVLDDRQARIARMHGLVERLATYPALSIAAIEGWALGGGLELAMACTFRVAAPGAKLGLPEIKLGVIPSYGGTQLAPRLLGASRALELLCLGEPVEAERAERLGLVNWLASTAGGALDTALGYAAKLAEHSLPALQAVRQSVTDGLNLPLSQALAIEASVSAELLAGESPPDAVGAFRNRNVTSR